jgi:prolyl oligopeptidase
MKRISCLPLVLLFSCIQNCPAQYNYPATKDSAVTDTYFGHVVTDKYRWLEDLTQPAVQSWFKAQADFSTSVLEKIKGRDSLFNRMKEIQEMGGDDFGGVIQRGQVLFYVKTKKEERLSKLYYRSLPMGPETLLFDPDAFQTGTQIMQFEASHDGKLVAVSLAKGGAEICNVRIVRVGDKTLLPDVLGPVWSEFPVRFTEDNTGLLYSKMSSADKLSDDLLKNMEARLHILGSESSKEVVLASRKKNPELSILAEQFPAVEYSAGSKYILLILGSVKNESLVYFAPVTDLKKETIAWKKLISFSDEITDFCLFGDQLFFLSHKNASNFKIGVTNIHSPNFETATWVVKESKKVIRGMHKTKNFLVYALSDGITQDNYQMDIKTNVSVKFPLPQGFNAAGPLNPEENDQLLVFNSNWLSPTTTYEYNAATGSLEKSKWFNASGKYPEYATQYAVKEIEIKSYDGTLVPLSIIYPKNIQLNGSTPCYLSGYGAYGISYLPSFIDYASAFLEQGCIIAYAHVRGGGEKGELWHTGGMKDSKANTWKDYIACAEYLVNEKYTSPAKLIGQGASMGGILIGRAITTRPDLFALAIVEVGETNSLRSELTPNGPNQIPEMGSMKNEQGAKNILDMDAQSKVTKGVKYPAVLIRCGMNDPRVVPWMPGKFAAVLQNCSASGKPVLLYTNYNNGHFTTDLDVRFREKADMFAFALWQVGHPKFQPH